MAARTAPFTARTADKHRLYQLAVQGPEADAAFLARYYRRLTGRRLRVLREDFCGTAALSCAFVRASREHRAVGVDLDAATLRWGRRHNVAALDADQRRRLRLIRADVRARAGPAAELLVALNFSYMIFRERHELDRWLRAARRNLVPGGVLMLDAFGGAATQEPNVERRRCHGFDYLWDQVSFDPLTYRAAFRIHFEFRDGTRLRNAFTYDWRLWTLPELRAALAAAGFTGVHVLWELTDARTGSGNGVFRRIERGTPDPAWIAYLIARTPQRPARAR
jgi:SAM-dependent methyltransferase